MVVVFWDLFYIGRTASSQDWWDWILPHPEHIQLAWLLSVPKVSKEKRAVLPHVHALCTLIRSVPTSQGWRAQGWVQCHRSPFTQHRLTELLGWEGTSGDQQVQPPAWSRVPQRRLLRAKSRWVLMTSKKCSVTYFISYFYSVIMLIVIM